MSELATLAAFAVANNHAPSASRVPAWELSIEDARAKVKVKDGNKKAKDDGSQALILGFSKKTLSLDAIAAGATRVNASKDQVEAFTATLQESVDSGAFDEAIKAAQADLKTASEAPKVAKVAPSVFEGTDTAGTEEVVAPVGVDLDELDDLLAE